jgi:hypothetical protein
LDILVVAKIDHPLIANVNIRLCTVGSSLRSFEFSLGSLGRSNLARDGSST